MKNITFKYALCNKNISEIEIPSTLKQNEIFTMHIRVKAIWI